MPLVREVRVVLVHRERRAVLGRLHEHLRVVELHVRADQLREHRHEARVSDHSREDAVVVRQIVEALQLKRLVDTRPCVAPVVLGAADAVEDASDRIAHLLDLRLVEDAPDEEVALLRVEVGVRVHARRSFHADQTLRSAA